MNENVSPEMAAAELEDLQERAKLLGVKYHPSLSADKLRERIKEHQEAAAKAAAGADGDSAAEPVVNDAKTAVASTAAPGETRNQKVARIREHAEKLVRVRVQCMNPAKKDWSGEIISVGNRAVGTLKKFVPFNNEEGWHIPQMIFDVMKARECQTFVQVKQKNGVSVRRGKLIREFAIEVLDPLTPDELQELARRQAMEAGQTV